MRPKLSYYHPNGRGTGCAVQFELHPAHDELDGSVWVTFAKQKTVGTRDGKMLTYPTFDWVNRIYAKLDMNDLMQMLQVFRGMQESIADGKGLFQRYERANVIIKLEHRIEPVPGYMFGIHCKMIEDETEEHAEIVFSMAEALGLSLAIEQSILYVAFGIPEVLK